MANKMIIDASHPEETRVVVLRGNRVEEFDFESANKRPLRGNIYLAKVTRVEPSLQAAFVDYGGNRHGFLAFSEIHPDYYQIPVADRQALLEEEAMSNRGEDDELNGERRSRRHRRPRPVEAEASAPDDETVSGPAPIEGEPELGEAAETIDLAHPSIEAESGEGEPLPPAPEAFAEPKLKPHPGEAFREEGSDDEEQAQVVESDESAEHELRAPVEAPAPGEGVPRAGAHVDEAGESPAESDDDDHSDDSNEVTTLEGGSEERVSARRKPAEDEGEQVEQIGGDALEEVPRRPQRLRRQYKIQEVIKRRQVLLVQVVKEERGNKGAALTTYLSLAGRYSVLMPNTARGGGISRKITNPQDRSRLKSIAEELDVPEGMGVILRTAGAARTKAEVKRDFEYLLRMWETVREMTLASSAPTLVYEEGSLIKRAIRDLYSKDVDEIVVAGEQGYREAREFMRLLMPSHVNAVQPYRDTAPVFAKAGVEAQLDAMFSNQVTLKSGGYIVINQTEALVAIDVNSGRSTREHNIEDTALRTNLEAADEIARQLRLRDLAGLIVVDFIDMEESRNNRAVERRIKDALKNDRARIQVGRISHFGLLEMSRQRIRTGVLEGSTIACPHCQGSGVVRSTASIALHVLRVLEDALVKSSSHDVIVRTRSPVALYILNQKRANLRDIERRFGVVVTVDADDTLTGSTYHAIERGEPASGVKGDLQPPPLAQDDFATIVDEPVPVEEDDAEPPGDDGGETEEASGDDIERESLSERDEGEGGRRRRRRRRRRGSERPPGETTAPDAPQPADDGLAVMAEIGGHLAPRAEGDDPDRGARPPDRRRYRRGRGRSRFLRTGPEQAAEQVGLEGWSGGDLRFEGPAAEADESARINGAANAASPASEEAPPAPAPAASHEWVGSHEPVASVASHEPVASAELTRAGGADRPAEPRRETAPPASVPEEGPAVANPASDAVAGENPSAIHTTPPVEEPPRPRRTGWWQRARATIVGSD